MRFVLPILRSQVRSDYSKVSWNGGRTGRSPLPTPSFETRIHTASRNDRHPKKTVDQPQCRHAVWMPIHALPGGGVAAKMPRRTHGASTRSVGSVSPISYGPPDPGNHSRLLPKGEASTETQRRRGLAQFFLLRSRLTQGYARFIMFCEMEVDRSWCFGVVIPRICGGQSHTTLKTPRRSLAESLFESNYVPVRSTAGSRYRP